MVSRETLIDEGLAQLGLSGGRAEERLARFAELLRARAVPRGYLGPREETRVVTRHILDALAVAPLVGEGHLVDVGSGAGLPGVVLACVREGPATLVEAQARRAQFLREVTGELSLPHVAVVNARAEDAARSELRESGDVVVARALAPVPVALELTVPFARPEGTVLISLRREEATGAPVGPERHPDQGGRAAHRVEQRTECPAHGSDAPVTSGDVAGAGSARAVSEALGGAEPEMVALGVPGLTERVWVMMVRKVRPTPDRFPRRAGVPERRPLGEMW